MEVVSSPEFVREDKRPVVLAMGAFDGLHLGHQEIINRAILRAQKENLPAAVYSFFPHPRQVIAPENAPGMLLTEAQKEEKLARLGIDFYFQQKFDKQFSQLSFEKFISRILLEKIEVSRVVVGEDFKFGYQGQGDIKLLKKYGNKLGFAVTVVPIFKVKGRRVSSSYIRRLVSQGEVAEIPDYLGCHYSLQGRVVRGAGRGKKLGFPTANLELLTDYVLPPDGVYAGYTIIEEERFLSLANFGSKPTFIDEDFSLEVHLIDFSGDLYERKLAFKIIERLRGEKRFSSPRELKEQIKKDILYTREILC